MHFCLISFHYSEPTNYLFVFISVIFIGVFIYSLRYWPEPEQVDKSKLNENEYVDSDVLGQEVKVYHDKSGSFRPMRVNWVKTGLLFVLGFAAFVLVYRNADKAGPMHHISGTEQIIFETGKGVKYKQSYNCYFCSDFELNEVQNLNIENLNTSVLEYINEPYVKGNVNNY